MKLSIFFIAIICLPSWGFSQNLESNPKRELLLTETLSIESTVNIVEEQWESEPVNPSEMVSNLNIAINQGDLAINFTLIYPKDKEFKSIEAFEIIPLIELDGERLQVSSYDDFRGDWGPGVKEGSKQIYWTQLLDKYVNIEGHLTITLTANLWGERLLPYDCDKGPPTFNGLPFIVAGGLGAAAIGAGQYFRSESKKGEKTYKEQTDLAVASPIYDKANQQNQLYRILTIAGATVVVVDVAWGLIRRRNHKRNVRFYNLFCTDKGESLTWAPTYDLPTLSQPKGTTGLRLSYSF